MGLGIQLIKLLIIYILIFESIFLFSQEQLERKVFSNGAGILYSDSLVLNATIGQAIIGFSGNESDSSGLGFWYTANKYMDGSLKSALVFIPNFEAEVGEYIDIPLILSNSNGIKGNSLKWEAKLRYNSTILYSLVEGFNCPLSDFCEIVISGTMNDSSGILITLPFRTKLGNSDFSNLEITEFQWVDENIFTIKRDGFLQLEGLCIIDGEYRLINRTVNAGIYNSYPNPIVNEVKVDFQLREKGINYFEVIDNKGVSVFTDYDIPKIAGIFSKKIYLSSLPSGSYFLNLVTPNEIFTRKIIIKR